MVANYNYVIEYISMQLSDITEVLKDLATSRFVLV